MKLLCELNDKIVLGLDGMSDKPPRLTARAIVRNTDDLYAVMYAAKFGLHSLPGGGIEDGEDALTALRREIFEETGCICDHIEELGIVTENRACQDFTSKSFYYVVTTDHNAAPIHLTDDEIANKTTVQWHTLDEIVRLISEPKHTTTQRMYLQARDVAALKEYLSWNKWDEPLMFLPPAENIPITVEILSDPGDWQLKKLENGFLAEIGEQAMTEEKQEQLQQAVRDGKITFFMAKRGCRAVGMCSVAKCFSTFACTDIGVFDDFYIEPVFRKKGVARKLAQAAQGWCKENSIASLTVCCAPCDEQMYQALGFDVPLGKTYAYLI